MAATNAMLGLVNRLKSRVFVVWFGRRAARFSLLLHCYRAAEIHDGKPLFGLGSEAVVLEDRPRPPAGRRLVQSSFRIVTVALPSSIVAPTAFESCTEKVSFASRLWSPLIETEIVRLVSPGWNVNVPLVAV